MIIEMTKEILLQYGYAELMSFDYPINKCIIFRNEFIR